MSESVLPHQDILDTATLAFWGIDFIDCPVPKVDKQSYDILGFRARGRAGYDRAENCVVKVYELEANVVENDVMYVDHRLKVEWNDEGIDEAELSLDTGLPVTGSEERPPEELSMRTRRRVMQGLLAVMPDEL